MTGDGAVVADSWIGVMDGELALTGDGTTFGEHDKGEFALDVPNSASTGVGCDFSKSRTRG